MLEPAIWIIGSSLRHIALASLHLGSRLSFSTVSANSLLPMSLRNFSHDALRICTARLMTKAVLMRIMGSAESRMKRCDAA